MSNLNEMLSNVTDFLKTEAKTETIIGQQFTLGEYTCVPVMSIGMGFGGGEGEGKRKDEVGGGIGAGAGMGITPVGFLVTHGKEIEFIPARNSKGLSAAFEKLPDVLEKYFDSKKKEKEAEVK